MRSYLILAGAALGLSTFAGAQSQQTREFTDGVHAIERRVGRLWPGFRLRRPIVIDFPGDGLVHIGHPPPSSGFRPMGSEAYFKEGGKSDIDAAFVANFPIGGTPAFLLKFRPYERTSELYALLVHELFHAFQDTAWPAASAAALSKLDQASDDSSYLENRALLEALTLTDNFAERARLFSALRRRRHLRSSGPGVRAELTTETREGAAEYVAQLALIPDTSDPFARAIVMSRSIGLKLLLAAPPDPAPGAIASLYGSGAAQMLLLDRIGVPWKARVEKGEAVYDVFTEYFPPEAAAARIAEAVASWSDPALERALRENGPAAGAADDSWKRFERSASPRLTIVIWDSKIPASLAFTGSAHPIPGDGRSTLYEEIIAGTFTRGEELSGTFRRTSVKAVYGPRQRMIGRMRQHPVIFEALLDDKNPALVIDDKEQRRLPQRASFKSLSWESPHLSLRSKRRGKLSRVGSDIYIEIEPPR